MGKTLHRALAIVAACASFAAATGVAPSVAHAASLWVGPYDYIVVEVPSGDARTSTNCLGQVTVPSVDGTGEFREGAIGGACAAIPSWARYTQPRSVRRVGAGRGIGLGFDAWEWLEFRDASGTIIKTVKVAGSCYGDHTPVTEDCAVPTGAASLRVYPTGEPCSYYAQYAPVVPLLPEASVQFVFATTSSIFD